MKRSAIIVDIILLAIYLLVANPVITGFAVHEWLSIGILLVFLVHIVMHYDWVIDVMRDGFRNPSLKRTGRLVLNILTFIVLIVCAVSGLLVSGDFLRTLGFFAPGYFLWGPLHRASAKLLLALIIVHILIHLRQMVAYFRYRGTK